jgi:PQQ-dependent dehydrogenase (methanol/ethanol family)
MLNRIRVWGLSALLSVVLVGCERSGAPDSVTEAQLPRTAAPPASGAASSAANVNAERLLNADAEPAQWMTYGGNYEEHRYSRLTQIDTQNVKDLGLVWFADYDSNLQQTGTPLYIDGVIYVSTAWSNVYAFDAKTGKQLWRYNPRVPGEWTAKVCCGLVNRGIAAWNGKIYVGTLDARLVAIDAKTGTETWSTLTFDESMKDSPIHRYSITSAPRVAKGMVFIGNAGSEFGVRGYVSAYDADTGEMLWRFYTVPGNPDDGFENEQMEMAAGTWSGEWWKVGGGGTVWDSVVYDPETDLVYIGTGNGTPWNQSARDPEGGDNLFIASIIALKADTGEYVWHYQTTPAETWDYDAASPMMIVNLDFDGQQRRVLLQPCKNGFFYMLDAAGGELLLAEAFTEMNWADGVDIRTGRPRVRPEARYEEAPFNLLPGVQGAHGWHSNAFNPDTGLIYIPVQHAYFPMVADPDYQQSDVGYNLAIDFGAQFTYYRDHPDAPREFVGYLKAWDPVAGREVWRGEPNQGPTGGALATAGGLIFQGGGSNQEFRAYDASTGEKLWSMQVQTGVLPGPISYELDGQQYIAASVGGNQSGGYYAPNYSRMLVFGLAGKAELPPVQEYIPRPLDPPPATAAAEIVAAGKEHYSRYCATCHGDDGQTRGSTFPNLTRSPMLHSQEAFDTVVLQGTLTERGMAAFAEALTPADSQAIRAFIVARANELKNAPAAGFGPPPVEQEQPHEER